jgi:dihydroneopterin aldolase/D-erythro-7,8-dihydroneopterin triphosphate epimerase
MEPLDILRIRDLTPRCRVGVTAEERKQPQEVVITVALAADLREACRTDRLAATVDYKAIKRKILKECETRSFKLIERLAQRVADIAFEDARVRRVRVSVQKPGALRFARCSEVEIIRFREPARGRGTKA